MSYRKPARPDGKRGVLARAVEPPRDEDAVAAQARREAGKLLAAQIAEDGRDQRRRERDQSLVRIVVDLVKALFR